MIYMYIIHKNLRTHMNETLLKTIDSFFLKFYMFI